MIRLLAPLLILVVMLTSIGLGAARGTVRQGTEVVLCTGHGIVVTHVPATGDRQAHLCPDMALSLLAALAVPDTGLLPRPARMLPASLVHGTGATPLPARMIRVRDPPLPLSA